VSRPLRYQPLRPLDHLTFAVSLLSFGYVAVQIILARERRLLAIENEQQGCPTVAVLNPSRSHSRGSEPVWSKNLERLEIA